MGAYGAVLRKYGREPSADSEIYKVVMKLDLKIERGMAIGDAVEVEMEKVAKLKKACCHFERVLTSKCFLSLVQNMVQKVVMIPSNFLASVSSI